MPGPWKSLKNIPSFSVDTMLLLTDGSVLCHEYESPNWHRLVPDAKGNYVNATWHAVTPLPANAPLSQNGPLDAPLSWRTPGPLFRLRLAGTISAMPLAACFPMVDSSWATFFRRGPRYSILAAKHGLRAERRMTTARRKPGRYCRTIRFCPLKSIIIRRPKSMLSKPISG